MAGCGQKLKMFLVSIIIPSYNGEKVIGDCLKFVYALEYQNFEVIVVDDASRDNSVAIIESLFPCAKVIRNSKNLGFAGTINRGIKESKGEIVVLLNMDTLVKKDWLSELVKVIISNEKAGIVGSKMLDLDGTTVQHAGGLINSNGVSVHIGRGEADTGQYDELREVDYLCGASMGFKKSLLEEIGCLDEGYSPLYYEDTDLAFRARRKGYKNMYVPGSVLVHNENYSTSGLTARFYYFYHKSRIRFVVKNYSFKYLFTKFLRAEINWFKNSHPKGLRIQLIGIYFITLLFLPEILYSKIRDWVM